MQNLLLAQVTEVNSDNNWVKVKFVDYDNITCKEFIPIMHSPIGESKEGISSPMAIDDLVVVAFFDEEKQNPLVLGKIYTSSEFISGKKIRFYEHEIEFTDDEVTITHKDSASKITMASNEVTVETSSTLTVEANQIKLGSGALVEKVIKGTTFQILYNAHVHVGNLGYPTLQPSTPSPPTDLSNKVRVDI